MKTSHRSDDDNPTPIALVREDPDNMASPIIPNPEYDGMDEIPIVPSPGYHADIFGSPIIHSSPNQPHGSSIREAESDGNSLGVLYQSTIGSVIHEDKNRSGNG